MKISSLLVLALSSACLWAGCYVAPQQPAPAYQQSAPAPQQAGLGQPFEQTDWSQAVAVRPSTPSHHVQPGQVTTDGIVAPLGFHNVQQQGIRVAYGPTQNFSQIRTAFQEAQVFEQIANTMNRIIVMPKVLHIQMAECGTVNAFYDPQNQRIIMCYEMVARTFQAFTGKMQNQDQVATAGVYAALFIFFHEFGHALRDILDLPVTGREEDAVDQFSTMLLIDAGSQDGVLMGAQFFGIESQRHNDSKTENLPFWDEHSLEQQRFYNILCLLYGSNPQAYQGLVDSGALPKPRAARCPAEYTNINKAWTRLLAPHLTQEAGGQAVAPTPHPMQPPVQPQNQPPVQQGQVTCAQVAQRAVELIVAQYQQQQMQLTQAQQQQLQMQLQQFHGQVIQQCQAEVWSPSSRQCVMQATTFEQVSHCN